MGGQQTTAQSGAAAQPARHTGAGHGRHQPDAHAPADAPLPEATDIAAIIAAVARFASAFETALRQIEPPLTLSQIATLDLIAARGAIRPFRLATQIGISRQLAWQTCKRLERLGLVAMQSHDSGRRGVDVTLTESGANYLAQLVAVEAGLADGLGAENVRAARLHAGRRLLNQMGALLTAEADPAEEGTHDTAAPPRPHHAATPPE